MNLYFVVFKDGSTEAFNGDSMDNDENFINIYVGGRRIAIISIDTINRIRINKVN